jgi:poly-gamma-glutamate synthesis protein (capsule biosynthesis protein)
MNVTTRAVLLVLLLCAAGAQGVLRFYGSYQEGFLSTYFRESEPGVLFVGDLMLARAVEDRVREVGGEHFFDKVQTLHERATLVVANFEASIQEHHVRSPDFTFRFSVDAALVPLLRRAHVTHVSLANNHADDFGVTARHYAEGVLERAGVVAFGTPRTLSASSTTYITVGESRVALIAIEAVFGNPYLDDVQRILADAGTQSEYQVIYIHWGEEYQPHHSAKQEALAHALVSYGADAIVGHHPHVIQDIGSIEGVPVFYSLGNYVFDQYFDDAVSKGLALMMYIRNHQLEFEIIPVATERSVPYVLDETVSKQILNELAHRSEKALRSDIVRGFVSHGAK